MIKFVSYYVDKSNLEGTNQLRRALMDKKTIEKFKQKLLTAKEQIINSGVLSSKEDLHISQDDLSDEADLANNVINQDISFRIREQEMNKLRRIHVALEKIEQGEFGHCEDCGETIGSKRLENQPWAELCIVHAEEREKESIFGRRRAA